METPTNQLPGYDFIGQAIDITNRLWQASKLYFSESLSHYDAEAQKKYTQGKRKGQYIRRGQPGDLILCPIAVYSHNQQPSPSKGFDV